MALRDELVERRQRVLFLERCSRRNGLDNTPKDGQRAQMRDVHRAFRDSERGGRAKRADDDAGKEQRRHDRDAFAEPLGFGDGAHAREQEPQRLRARAERARELLHEPICCRLEGGLVVLALLVLWHFVLVDLERDRVRGHDLLDQRYQHCAQIRDRDRLEVHREEL
eukprot:Amastigsp_a9605_21.p4 type:complete len:167 gc:universal Amastigsp_a9605_21:295-795(+)